MAKLWLKAGKLITCGGKLAYQADCPCEEAAGCPCPDGPTDATCWPCNGMHYWYLVSCVLHWEEYESTDCTGDVAYSGTCTFTDLKLWRHDYAGPCMYQNFDYPSCDVGCNGTGVGQPVLAWNDGTQKWDFWTTGAGGFSFGMSSDTDVLTGAWSDTSPTCTEINCQHGSPPAMRSVKWWVTDISVVSGGDPACDAFDCAGGTWSLYGGFPDEAAFCAFFGSGAPWVHYQYDGNDYYDYDGMPMMSWGYSKTWSSGSGDAQCDGSAYSSFGFGALTDPVLIDVTILYAGRDLDSANGCVYQTTCTPPEVTLIGTGVCA